jgi:redox-sensing transcriptional repressor
VRHISHKTIGRLALYRRILLDEQDAGTKQLFSHELAALARVTAAQVRRDLMALGGPGSPVRGYAVDELLAGIAKLIDPPAGKRVALVGVGNLGSAVCGRFAAGGDSVVAAFDRDPRKVGRVVDGSPVYPVGRLGELCRALEVGVAIITVPPEEAQAIADTLIEAGVTGILNFAPISLSVPVHVYLEDIDVAMLLERVAFFARADAQRVPGRDLQTGEPCVADATVLP